MPGAAAYVRIGDEEWRAVRGVSDLETQEPFEATDQVRIASNTKPFVATVVLQLIDEGLITLNDVLESYVPGIPNGDIITVRDLLQMSSGVWDLTSDEPLMATWADDLMMPWSVEDSIELVRSNPSRFEPGSKVIYTDSNYILLGEIAEIVTGTPLHELVQTKILDPLGLDDTRFPAPDQPDVPAPAAQGYRPPGEQLGSLDELIPVGDINPEVAWGAGNMTSTLADLAVLGGCLRRRHPAEPRTAGATPRHPRVRRAEDRVRLRPRHHLHRRLPRARRRDRRLQHRGVPTAGG